jgi:hypothetical protein
MARISQAHSYKPWTDRLDELASIDGKAEDYRRWRRALGELYVVARWLPDYVDVYQNLPRFVQRDGVISLVDHWWPSASPSHQRRGTEGASLIRALGTGANWMIREGVRAVPLSAYAHMHTRICRPVGLAAQEVEQLVDYVISRLGQQYDLKNLFDLARYLLPAPPVPLHWRRRMIAFGSGDPSRAICSTLIAQAFQAVHYPILPEVTYQDALDGAGGHCRRELLHIRHHSLYAPRDFDMSPYFEVVKPTLRPGFDPHRLAWENDARSEPERR